MNPALLVTIEFTLPNESEASDKAYSLMAIISNRVGFKPLWKGQENRVVSGQSKSGNSTVDIELRFEKTTDRDEIVGYLKSLDDRPNVQVTGTTHDCYHDEGGRSCDNQKEI